MEFSEQEIETIKELLRDHGSDCPCADSSAIQALGEKLGVYEPEKPPTEEELKRREELANSPAGKMMRELINATNQAYAASLAEQITANSFFDGEQWEGGRFRIKLPNDFLVRDNPLHINKIAVKAV
jgi:hypothetical protein